MEGLLAKGTLVEAERVVFVAEVVHVVAAVHLVDIGVGDVVFVEANGAVVHFGEADAPSLVQLPSADWR